MHERQFLGRPYKYAGGGEINQRVLEYILLALGSTLSLDQPLGGSNEV